MNRVRGLGGASTTIFYTALAQSPALNGPCVRISVHRMGIGSDQQEWEGKQL